MEFLVARLNRLGWGGLGAAVLLGMGGCNQRPGPAELGTIVEKPEDFPGYGEPYPLPQLDLPATPDDSNVAPPAGNSDGGAS